jgi:hypothetical protein
MRLAVPIAIVLAAVSLGGCSLPSSNDSTSTTSTGETTAPQGGAESAPSGASAQSCRSSVLATEALRATGVSCGEASAIVAGWRDTAGCAGSPGASHAACTVRSYRCIGTRTDRGLAVGCARPGRSIAFISKGG